MNLSNENSAFSLSSIINSISNNLFSFNSNGNGASSSCNVHSFKALQVVPPDSVDEVTEQIIALAKPIGFNLLFCGIQWEWVEGLWEQVLDARVVALRAGSVLADY